TAAALVDLSTVAGNKISNPPWVKFQSAGWVNFPSAPTLMDDPSSNGRDQDEGWSTQVAVVIEPDSRLKPEQKLIIETDYGMREGRLVIETRGALVQYVLQRYQIDPTKVHAKATAQQIVVANLDELQPWLYH
ncbi:hypothetical protein ACRCPH_27465, partial [Pseudomonas aeruginosa]